MEKLIKLNSSIDETVKVPKKNKLEDKFCIIDQSLMIITVEDNKLIHKCNICGAIKECSAIVHNVDYETNLNNLYNIPNSIYDPIINLTKDTCSRCGMLYKINVGLPNGKILIMCKRCEI
jgi:hypothetical protein